MVIRTLGEFRRGHTGARIHLTEGKNDEILTAVRRPKNSTSS
jgi:hypothetical protein